jgi:hypothetical protein
MWRNELMGRECLDSVISTGIHDSNTPVFQHSIFRSHDFPQSRIAKLLLAPASTGQNGIFMFIPRGAAAEKPQHATARVGDLMNCVWRYGNGIADTHLAGLLGDSHQPPAFQNVVDLFGLNMVMGGRSPTSRQPRLGKRLVADARVAMSQKLPDFRPVLRGEGWDLFNVLDVH